MQRRKLDVLRLRRRLDVRDQVAQREAAPRNDHRPCFHAAQPVDAVLQRVRRNEILEVIDGGLRDVSFYGDGPGPRLKRVRVARRIFLAGAELVEVVIRGDRLPGRELFLGILDRLRLSFVAVARRDRDGADRCAEKAATIQVDGFRRDLGRWNIQWSADQHAGLVIVRRAFPMERLRTIQVPCAWEELLQPAGVVGTRNEGDMKRHTALRRLLAAAILTGACAPAFQAAVRAEPELCRTGPVAFYVPEAGAHRAVLDRWCAAVGPAVFVPARSAAMDVERITSEPDDSATIVLPVADSVLIVAWNNHVGGGALERFVD